MALRTFLKDPSAKLPYSIDWSQWLGSDVIQSSTWTVAAGIDNLLETNSVTAATIILGGGSLGGDYEVTNHIVTAAGHEDQRSFVVSIVDR
jgi:hypothetical protein